MGIEHRLDRLERLADRQETNRGLSPVELALDMAAMAASVPAPDFGDRARQLAKIQQLRQALDSDDVSKLLPGDLVIRPPAEAMTG